MAQQSQAFPTTRIGKPLYAFYAISTSLLALPYHLVINAIPSRRPHPQWTYHQAVMNTLMNAFLYHAAALELQTPLSLSPDSEGSRFALLPPAREDLYQGVLSPSPKTSPTTIGGVWYPTPYSPTTDASSTILLYFHGGAFVLGTARPSVCDFASTTLNNVLDPAKTLSFSYRLANRTDPSCAFPAALQDSLTAYTHLRLTLSIPARRIVFAADSAGSNIAIALLRYLASPHGATLGLEAPKAAILCSPWVDVYATRSPSFRARYDRTPTDYVPAELQLWGAKRYVPASTTAEMDAYISPLGAPFETTTRLWVLLGGGEVLGEEGARWAEEMRGLGGEVAVEVVEGANHAVLGVGGIMGFKGEVEKAVGRAKEWILGEG